MINSAKNELITIDFKKMNWKNALSIICNKYQLKYRMDGNILIIDDAKINSEKKRQFKNRSIHVHHLSSQSIQQIILDSDVYSDGGTAIYYEDRNIIMVRDGGGRFNMIKEMIQQLDTMPSQIHITENIVTMSNESIDELGIKWGYDNNKEKGLNKLNVNLGVSNPSKTAGFNIATWAGGYCN